MKPSFGLLSFLIVLHAATAQAGWKDFFKEEPPDTTNIKELAAHVEDQTMQNILGGASFELKITPDKQGVFAWAEQEETIPASDLRIYRVLACTNSTGPVTPLHDWKLNRLFDGEERAGSGGRAQHDPSTLGPSLVEFFASSDGAIRLALVPGRMMRTVSLLNPDEQDQTFRDWRFGFLGLEFSVKDDEGYTHEEWLGKFWMEYPEARRIVREKLGCTGNQDYDYAYVVSARDLPPLLIGLSGAKPKKPLEVNASAYGYPMTVRVTPSDDLAWDNAEVAKTVARNEANSR